MVGKVRFLPPPKGCPEHLSRQAELMHALRRWANIVYAQYGVPVYLCGSVLKHDVNDPRDWDVRIRLPKAQFAVRYGSPEVWWEEGQTGFWSSIRWRWVDDCKKQARRGAKYTGLNIDFEVHPPMFWDRHRSEPKLRIDTRRERWKRRT